VNKHISQNMLAVRQYIQDKERWSHRSSFQTVTRNTRPEVPDTRAMDREHEARLTGRGRHKRAQTGHGIMDVTSVRCTASRGDIWRGR